MNVGILTFSQANNFGALLQAYALQQTLAGLGHQAEIIRYPAELGFLAQWSFLRNRMRKEGHPAAVLQAYYAYRRFREHCFHQSPPCNTFADLRQLAGRYDAIIVGSDQVWHPKWVPLHIFFLAFADRPGLRRISYAACTGVSTHTTASHILAQNWLTQFSAISVRNAVTREVVHDWLGHDVPIVADPTLLHDFHEFDSVPLPRDIPDQFILVYALEHTLLPLGYQLLAKLKANRTLPVVTIIPSCHSSCDFQAADIALRHLDPRLFPLLFKKAAFILTDSFHGSIFSIKSQKPFLCYGDLGPRSPRLQDLTQRYGLEKAFVTSAEACPNISLDLVLPYDRINTAIRKHLASSFYFLTQSLQ
jgi:hypothetical protein